MTMNSGSGAEMSGLVPGATAAARAARLAGALAELSVTRLELAPSDSEPRILRAREADLPREIVAIGSGRVTPAGLQASFEITPEQIVWRAYSPEAAAALRARLK